MNAFPAVAVSALFLLVSCASSPSAPSESHQAIRRADGTIELTVTAKSERLTSSSSSFSLGLTNMLESAAAEECGGEFELTQDAAPSTEIKDGRMVATLQGVARCK